MSTSAKKEERAGELPGLAGARSLSRWLVAGVLLLALLLFFVMAGDDWFTIMNNTLIAAIAVLALNVLSGYTGQISLGLAFFMAVGAYTAAFLGGTHASGPLDPQGLELPWLIWLPAAGVMAALLGALIGPTALRVKGFYLGIVTLALVFIGHYIFLNLHAVTGGPQGRTFPAPAIGGAAFDQQNSLLGLALTTGQQYFLLILPVLALTVLFTSNVMRSRAGRAMRAVRDHEVGAAIMGVNLFEVKMGAFLLSSFLAGIAGALFASYNSYVIPDYWDLTLSIQFVAAIIIGGVASIWGSLLGALFVFGLPQIINHFSLLPPPTGNGGLSSGDLNTLIYGALTILFLLFEPGGLAGLLARLQRRRHTSASSAEEGGDPAEISDLSTPNGRSEQPAG